VGRESVQAREQPEPVGLCLSVEQAASPDVGGHYYVDITTTIQSRFWTGSVQWNVK
jgi:hypothetical protein